DDGYDISDYTSIHPGFGTLNDFKVFVEEAHRRGIRVITELVINHTSDQHPWFQRARNSPAGSKWRDFYVWSDNPDRMRGVRIIFQDYESSNWAWDPVAKAYYWHRFYSHQPDLNFRSAHVRALLFRLVDLWLGMGVDGLRLDAVPYLFEEDGTDCENRPETHDFLRDLRRHVDERFADRMLLAEANQWPEDAVAYFGKGDGDECHMAFHFPLMPRLFMGLRMEDRFPIIDIMQQTPEIPSSSQWALFLRNHDELTLEMVTDEERDYMYRSYARDPVMRINLGIRRRLAPLLGYHRQKIELMNGLLMSLPGTPVLYYGDEIGMGDNVYLGDRDSVRTPMQWSSDRNAGFSAANPQRLFLPVNTDPYCHYESVNVDAQMDNPDSLLRWVRRLIALRKRHKVFGRGRMDFVASDNPRVLSFVRHDEHEQVLVVANLSRNAQFVELDLAQYRGMTPLELSGQTPFPMIGELPYLITLAPYTFYWLELRRESADEPASLAPTPLLTLRGPWWKLLEGDDKRRFESALPAMLRGRRWFGAKDRRIHAATISDRITIPLEGAAGRAEVLVIGVEYLEGEPDRYLLPIVHAEGTQADAIRHDHPEAILARLRPPGSARSAGREGREGREGGEDDGAETLLVDAHFDGDYGRAIAEQTLTRRRRKSQSGAALTGSTIGTTAALVRTVELGEGASVRLLSGEQSNSSIVVGDPDGQRMILKAYRRLQQGTHPELEIDRQLTEAGANVARLFGSLQLTSDGSVPMTLAIAHEHVPHEADAWSSTLRTVGAWLEQPASRDALPEPQGGFVAMALAGPVPDAVRAAISDMVGLIELLGMRTAELHADMAGADGGPERTTPLAQRALYQSIRTSARRALAVLRQRSRQLPPRAQPVAAALIESERPLLDSVARILEVTSGARIRVHGD
ncbi:MAG TPA: maltose alpha-D-glucosyltransferase, partial [Acidimicrobiales bacterium]|nr:maltose alpha-D-glucosyltransferase [Acidimicrobiales bacterium]